VQGAAASAAAAMAKLGTMELSVCLATLTFGDLYLRATDALLR
jgi:hypothetical protein